MSQSNTSTAEGMKRVRANLHRRKQDNVSPGVLRPKPGFGSSPSATDRSRDVVSLVADIPTNNLLPLRIEIDGALAGHKLVGQVNPRPPGIHNQAVQFAKRAMLRTLTWYTRPLHYFQGSVIRAFQQILTALDSQDHALQMVKEELSVQRAALDATARRSFASFNAIRSANQAALEKQSAEFKRREATFTEEITRLEETDQAQHRSLLELHEGIARWDGKLERTGNALLSRAQESAEAAIAARFNPAIDQLANFSRGLDELRNQVERVRSQVGEMSTQGRLRDRDLRKYLSEALRDVSSDREAPTSAPIPAMFPSEVKADANFDYFRFEELYRGDEALIASRQREYLDAFRGREDVVDIGCGRGEFLQLLRENGIRARGVELGTDQYLLCREKGLDVVQQDLFAFLEAIPDESLGGLFSAQVIEHLPASDQLRFIALAYQKTTAGSPVIFETINAQSVFAVVRNFFIDPTHVRPVHPETLKFAMECAKFRDVKLRFSSPLLERRIPPLKISGAEPELAEFNRAVDALNDLIYGYLDYAAIGWH
jgi:SAM-dependent methyltransferase